MLQTTRQTIVISSHDNDHREFLQIIKQEIALSPLPIYRLAETAGVNPHTIGRWIDGTVTRPRVDTLHKVLRVLGFKLIIQKENRYV